jgi:hypothetical protein
MTQPEAFGILKSSAAELFSIGSWLLLGGGLVMLCAAGSIFILKLRKVGGPSLWAVLVLILGVAGLALFISGLLAVLIETFVPGLLKGAA